MDIWQVLVQFIFRLSFGLALAMAVTPHRYVSSGFYRVHLWVLMGLNTLAAMAVYSRADASASAPASGGTLLAVTIGCVVLAYVGSVLWLYELSGVGQVALLALAALELLAGLLATSWSDATAAAALTFLDLTTGGMLLGTTLAAMLLGHWYLNTPGMDLRPLQRLLLLLAAIVLARMGVAASGLVMEVLGSPPLGLRFWIFTAFRWLTGLVGTLGMATLAWYALKVPNTQSATGILYAGVIMAFLGELTSRLLSVATAYPV